MRLACQRHLDDLRDGPKRGLWYDVAAAELAVAFFALLQHSKGKWAGQPFVLEPWQSFFVGSVFGWRRADGTRRFRTAHLEVARKNGKTTLAAGVGLLLLCLDGEPGAEVYTVATKRDQARLTHDESKRMVKASPAIARRVGLFKDALTVEATDSKYLPLASDSDSLDGLNVHGAVCDELHAWKWRELWDVIETATGARSQPLILSTTTAGTGRTSIWWERREVVVRMLRGVVPDDSVFGVVYTLDEGDDWTDERVWPKANPSLGVSIQLDELREKCEQAKQTPGKQNAFKRLRLNVPTDQVTLWLDLAKWDACAAAVSWDDLAGRECFSGLDLAATTDLAAMAHAFKPEADGDPWRLLLRFWLPEEGLRERCRRDHVPYDLWAQQGFLELIPGPIIDYDVIEARIREDAARFQMRELAFDRYFANQLTTGLMNDGFNVVGFGQGFLSMAAPVRELELLVAGTRLAHGGHPVLRFNAASAAVKSDPAGNRKPDKASSTGRIDGLVAALMAIGRAILGGESSGGGGFEAW